MSKCPHKVKKGEKRSNECRCDEQGRYCCLLETDHWELLMRLEKPGVTFFSSREALEATQHGMRAGTPATPSYYMPSTPGSMMSIPSTPAVRTRQMSLLREPSTPFESIQSSQSTLTPQFGYMGLGSPVGTSGIQSPDPLAWDGIMTSIPYEPLTYNFNDAPQPERGSCCQPSASLAESEPQAQISSCCQPATDGNDDDYDMEAGGSCCQTTTRPAMTTNTFAHNEPFPKLEPLDPFRGSTAPPTFDAIYTPPIFDYDRWVQNYQAYQMPGAICQKCGLNGCTCRSCPTLMQNQSTTSWAHGCGRAHARIMKSQPPPHMHSVSTHQISQPALTPVAFSQSNSAPPPSAFDYSAPLDFGLDPQVLAPTHPFQNHMDLDGFDSSLVPTNTADPLDLALSEFLMSELDRPSHTHGENTFGS
ncbi:hypothetical protein B0A48_04212 [Cryoendolithus antarcticus]|uniref:Copper-fist domain-containing protein n=1 Tax=Cryoendolithus antarcticus TaxID=1507870 RepID=A0A1V8TEP9_9PEZI|nr:hypothetical protein B0A48_04212 [Cryoendolithus antarcticus]